MKLTLTTLALVAMIGSASAANIAIVDSGSDLGHKDLKDKAWINSVEIPDNNRDEDKNGYPDDMHGWNFAEGNNKIIDYKYVWSDTPDVRRFFDIQLKSFLGTITAADKEWANSKLNDPKFIKDISVFGNWMHGTHVMGIAAKFSDDAKMMGIKLIPTEVTLPGQDSNIVTIATKEEIIKFDLSEKSKVKDFLVKKALGALAKQQSAIFSEIGYYMHTHKIDVMNGSFGTGYGQMQAVISQLVETILRKKPSAAELKLYTDHYFSVAVGETRSFTTSAPKTLFIFAAGNDGSNNDVYPATPANVVADNKITVAASLGDQELANFSNYGEKNVEVAAPGVGIYSQSPMDSYIHVSGTSQAAPYVAGIAGAVKDLNPKLDYKGIKRIILETVDVKSWLKGKVKTSGLVNAKRAARAAELSTVMDLTKAIAIAKDEVADTSSDKSFGPLLRQVPAQWVMPLPSTIIVK